MKTTSTKRALVLSVLALVICVSMLVGTTFAWFTDSVTSGMNRIQAGNLDVELLMDKAENGTYAPIGGDDGDIFSEATGNGILWEPGKTEIVYLAVENKGSLALKYNFLLNITDGDPVGLVGALEYAVLNNVKKADMTATSWAEIKAAAITGNVAEGVTLAAPNGALLAGKTEYFALAVHMKEEAGNEFQNGEIIIDVILNATQLTYEEDSFGSDYDKLATFPNGAFTVRKFEKVVPVTAPTFEIANDDETVKVSGTAAAGATEVAVYVEPTSTNNDLTAILADNVSVSSYDIEVVGYEAGTVVTVDIFAGKNLTNVKVFHEGVEMAAADYSYDPITGFVTISATDFSVYSISHNTLGQHPLAKVEYIVDLPTVEADGNEYVLDAGYKFSTVQTVDEAKESDYRYWHADFVVTFNKDVAEGTLGLAGQYDAYNPNWLAFLAPDVAANQPIRLLADAGKEITGNPIYINYEELCDFVKEFNCGAFDVDGANAGTTISVELRLYETADPDENLNSTNIETGNYIVVGSYNYTF